MFQRHMEQEPRVAPPPLPVKKKNHVYIPPPGARTRKPAVPVVVTKPDVLIDVGEVLEPVPKKIYYHTNWDKTKVLVWINFVCIIVLFVLFLFVFRPVDSTVVKYIEKDGGTGTRVRIVSFVLSKLEMSINLGTGIDYETFSYNHCCQFGDTSISCNNILNTYIDKSTNVLNVSTTDESLLGAKCKIIY